MPTYNFRCQVCGHEFEKHLHMSDDKSGVACPNCGKSRTQRVYISVPVAFKGSGFYVTDNGRAKKKAERS